MQERTDLRILRTRKSIQDAFLSLLQEKEFSKITVRDITDRAFINRNTFYLHYSDKENLLKSLCTVRLDHLKKLIKQPQKSVHEEALRTLILKILEEISHNQVFYQTMINDETTSFSNQLKTEIVAQMLENMQAHNPNFQALFCIEYAVTGFIGVIRFSLNHPNTLSVNETAELVFRLLFGNLLDLL